jgi:hypothetical protein
MSSASEKNGNGHYIGSSLRVIATGLIVSFCTAVTTVLFVQASQVAALQEQSRAHSSRLSSLESGRTTPMAAETRAEFNAVWRELEKIRTK